MSNYGLISDDWLISYAAGNLSNAQALIVASHCDYHDALKKKVNDAENIASSLALASNESASLSDGLFDQMMAKIDQGKLNDEKSEDFSHLDMPLPLANYLKQPLEDLKWRSMGPGLSQVKLEHNESDERLWLLRAKAGAKIPSHDHRGLEMTLVLKGSYSIDDQTYSKGMIEIADDDHHDHMPVIGTEEECICLVVTEAPLKIHSFFGKLAQPFIGL